MTTGRINQVAMLPRTGTQTGSTTARRVVHRVMANTTTAATHHVSDQETPDTPNRANTPGERYSVRHTPHTTHSHPADHPRRVDWVLHYAITWLSTKQYCWWQ